MAVLHQKQGLVCDKSKYLIVTIVVKVGSLGTASAGTQSAYPGYPDCLPWVPSYPPKKKTKKKNER